jgi:two-component system sensor histidine kinase/response regulator
MGMLRSRQALAQNEAMLLQAQRLARIGHFTFDAATDTLTGSPTHNEILGVPPDEIMNTQSWLAVIHPEDRQRTAAYSRDHVFRGRQPFDSEYRIIRRDDGEERWIQTAGQIVIGPDGRVSRLFGTSQDITERKQFEQRLRQNEAALREAQAIAHLGSWRLDIRSEQLTWSEEVYRIFGVAGETALTLDDFVARIHPEDRERVLAEWQAALNGKPYDNEHRIPVGDDIRWVRERAHIRFDDAGQPLSAVGTVQDVTERHQAEEQLRKLSLAIEQSPHSIVITNTEPKIEYVNSTFVRNTGYTPAEASRPESAHPEIRQDTQRQLRPAVANPGPRRNLAGRIRQPAQGRYDLRGTGDHFAGAPAGWAGDPLPRHQGRHYREKRIQSELESYRQHLEQLVDERTRN